MTKNYVDLTSALVSVQCSALGHSLVQYMAWFSTIHKKKKKNWPISSRLAEIITAENLLLDLGHN